MSGASVRALPRMVMLGVASALFLAPFAYMVAFSVKAPSEIFSGTLSLLPASLAGLANFPNALTRTALVRHLVNGVIVCAGILAFQLLLALPCAYAVAKLRFRGREWAFGLVLFGLLIPIHATSLPTYLGLAQLGALDRYVALIVPFVSSSFAVFLFRQFIRTVPNDLIDSARLDGCSELTILVRIVLPLARPTVTAFAIFSVVAHWNDVFWPLIVIRSPDLSTPPLGIMGFRSAEAGDRYGELMAASLLVTAPLVVAFLAAQRRFIEGISLGALKG
jgi:multiple sugar transport system permease protein